MNKLEVFLWLIVWFGWDDFGKEEILHKVLWRFCAIDSHKTGLPVICVFNNFVVIINETGFCRVRVFFYYQITQDYVGLQFSDEQLRNYSFLQYADEVTEEYAESGLFFKKLEFF